MQHTIKQIIENQTKFEKEIFAFFSQEWSVAKKILNNIKSEDKYIVKEKKKLQNKFKKVKEANYIKSLFFLKPLRSEIFYVWWDINDKEAKVFKYDKR